METTTIKPIRLTDEALELEQRMRGISYARAAGIGLGLFFLAWAPATLLRWDGQGPGGWLIFQTCFLTAYGVMLAMPWSRIKPARLWKYCFGILIALSLCFTFVMVIDVLFLHSLAAETMTKPPPPAFPGLQIFFGLMQVPAVLFLRKPELLD